MSDVVKPPWHSKSSDLCTAVMAAPTDLACSRCGDIIKAGDPAVLIVPSDQDGPSPNVLIARWCRICIGIKAQNYTRIAAALSRKDWQRALGA